MIVRRRVDCEEANRAVSVLQEAVDFAALLRANGHTAEVQTCIDFCVSL